MLGWEPAPYGGQPYGHRGEASGGRAPGRRLLTGASTQCAGGFRPRRTTRLFKSRMRRLDREERPREVAGELQEDVVVGVSDPDVCVRDARQDRMLSTRAVERRCRRVDRDRICDGAV